MIDTEKIKERFILVGVDTGAAPSAEDSLCELTQLVETAGGEAICQVIQKMDAFNAATYVGSGKVGEIKPLIAELEADGIVCDDELSPAQLENLEEALETKILDRTQIILEIFALHARTNEGKIQVETAQLKYRLSRLTGMNRSLSRLGGGIGTRGPGESKLETDRRSVRTRIAVLNRELKKIEQNRDTNRRQRMIGSLPLVAIAGYTNAGKSTLLNRLTNAEVPEADRLFETLDPVTRIGRLPGGQEVLFTDTVGFIHKLPHHLIDAFRSTLEEAKYADMILHVVDMSSPGADLQMKVVYDTLSELGISGKSILTAFNKTDLADKIIYLRDLSADRSVRISAKTGEGCDKLLLAVEEMLNSDSLLLEKVFSYQETDLVALIRRRGKLLEEDYREDGIFVRANLPKRLYQQIVSNENENT